MIDLANDEKYKQLIAELNEYADLCIATEQLDRQKHLDDHNLRKREYRKTERESSRAQIKPKISNYIQNVFNLEDQKYVASRLAFDIMHLSTDKKVSQKSGKSYKVKNLFFDDGLELICQIAENHPMTELGRDRAGKYIKGVKNESALARISDTARKRLEAKRYSDPLEAKFVHESVPTAELIREYVKYTCECASDYNETIISAGNIMELLERNSSLNGFNATQASIFDEPKETKQINKKMVLEVAKVYAQNIDADAISCDENNEQFDNNMKKMFTHIVTKYHYTPNEVEELKETLVTNANDERFMSSIADGIALGYTKHRTMQRRLQQSVMRS